MTTTRHVLAMLGELITLSALDEGSPQSFKVRAYEKAKLSLEADGRDLTAPVSYTHLTLPTIYSV